MKGDFTRFTHQPHRHYAGVLMQQGRVTLDADWNEQFDIDDRRWRLQTIDTIGRACAPVDAPGFGLVPTPDGSDLVITPGRIYLDGILVEVPEGTWVGVVGLEAETVIVRDLAPDGRAFEPGQWVEVTSSDRDDVFLTRIEVVDPDGSVIEVADDLSELADDDGVVVRRIVTYLTQPYYPAGSPLGDGFQPGQWDGRTHLVYLDVWRRHVTAIEDPYLREVALGGPDTATRVQTVWTVRILHADGEPVDATGLSCTDDIDAWDDLVAPSAGRLSARAEAAADPEDPCAIEPEAGYRGLENRLYRVEIHTPGPRGTATYKWSRENGSVLSSIVDVPAPTEIDVHSLGKDRVLRFSADDRVEVLSDDTELAGTTGTMASIVGAPDEADRRITLDQDVSVHETQRRPRVRRWDHGGVEPVTAAGWTDLELGVQVRFGAGPFEIGDWWVIPARVATGDVEGFVDAPPRGITHHFARLALVTWGTDDPVLDCRHRFTGLCDLEPGDGDHCCSISVGDGGDVDSLAAAVELARAIDGPVRICVLPGEHRLADTVVVDVDDLTISGCGRRSRLVASGNGALRIQDASDVRLEDLVITSASAAPTVAVVDARFVDIVDCRVANRGRAELSETDDLTAPTGDPRGHHFGAATDLVDGDDDGSGATGFAATHGPEAFVAAAPVPRSPGPAVGTRNVRSFRIHRCDLRGRPAISAQGDEVTIEHNSMTGGGVWLREGTESAIVSDNRIMLGHGQGVLLGGLLDDEEVRDERSGLRTIVVRENRIQRMSREGIGTSLVADDRLGEVVDVVIEHNEISECGVAPIADQFAIGGGILLTNANEVTIIGNRVVRNGPPANTRAVFVIGFGIACAASSVVEVSGNTVLDNGPSAADGERTLVLNAGIAGLLVVGDTTGEGFAVDGPAFRAHDNVVRVDNGPAFAVIASGPVSVASNHAVSRYAGRQAIDFARGVLIVDLGAAPDLAAGVNAVGAAPVRRLHGRVQFADNQVTVQGLAAGLPEPDSDDEPSIIDTMTGSAVALMSFDDVSIHGNQVVNEITPLVRRIAATVWAFGTTLRTGQNRVTELPSTARFSYAGFGLVHHVIDNVMTHCIFADGPTRVVEHNTLPFCLRFDRIVDLPVSYYLGD